MNKDDNEQDKGQKPVKRHNWERLPPAVERNCGQQQKVNRLGKRMDKYVFFR